MDLKAQFSVSFPSGSVVECDLAVRLGKFELIVLFGPSGCGKTTILRCLAGLQRPTIGFIKAGDHTWFCSSRQMCQTPAFRRSVGYVFQDSALFPHLSVEKNIAYGLYGWPRAERKARVLELISLMGLEGLALRRPAEISGGQKQRVALARALAPKPQLVLLDEPLASLDNIAACQLRHSLKQILETLCVPTILVTHNYQEALTMGDKMLLMSEGRIIDKGAPVRVLSTVGCGTQSIVEAMLSAKIIGRSNGLLQLQVDSVKLLALDSGCDFKDAYIRICSEGIVIEKPSSTPDLQQNYFSAVITRMESIGTLQQLYLDIGIIVKTVVETWTCIDLKLGIGKRVNITISTNAIHIIPKT